MPSEHAWIALGGNLGPVLQTFSRAIAGLKDSHLRVCKLSSAYCTQALLPPGVNDERPDYWNAVVEVTSHLPPLALLKLMQRLEDEAGRERAERWQSRTLDLDLLAFADREIHSAELRVPHPELHRRAFVLVPFAEIAPNYIVPRLNKTVGELLSELGRTEAKILGGKRDWLSSPA